MEYYYYFEKVLKKPMIQPEHLEMVLQAVQKAFSIMQYGKRYTLPEMVKLVDESQWKQLQRGDCCRVGIYFSYMVGEKIISKLKRSGKKGATNAYELMEK